MVLRVDHHAPSLSLRKWRYLFGFSIIFRQTVFFFFVFVKKVCDVGWNRVKRNWHVANPFSLVLNLLMRSSFVGFCNKDNLLLDWVALGLAVTSWLTGLAWLSIEPKSTIPVWLLILNLLTNSDYEIWITWWAMRFLVLFGIRVLHEVWNLIFLRR